MYLIAWRKDGLVALGELGKQGSAAIGVVCNRTGYGVSGEQENEPMYSPGDADERRESESIESREETSDIGRVYLSVT